MYRQWANFKLQASIYRYYIGAGAATYFLVPGQLKIGQEKRQHFDKIQEELRLLKNKGLYAQ